MYRIELTPEAIEDLRFFRKHDMRRIIEKIGQLEHQPAHETRNRKKLRPNQLAEWELRLDKFRVFYDIDEKEQRVKIEAIGYKKGSSLFVHGKEYKL